MRNDIDSGLKGRHDLWCLVGLECDAPNAPDLSVQYQGGFRKGSGVLYKWQESQEEHRPPVVSWLIHTAAQPVMVINCGLSNDQRQEIRVVF